MSDNHDLEELEDKAVSLLDSGKLRRSERVLKEILKLAPDSVIPHFHLARVDRRTGQHQLALFHGRRVLRLNPTKRNACLNVGLIYDLMERSRLAVSYYKRELSTNPDSVETLFNMGRLYFGKRQWRKAARYLRSAFDKRYMFRMADTAHKLGKCYQKMGAVRDYIEVYNQYLLMFPQSPWAAANVARALDADKQYQNAVLHFMRAKRLDPDIGLDEELKSARQAFRKEGIRKKAHPNNKRVPPKAQIL